MQLLLGWVCTLCGIHGLVSVASMFCCTCHGVFFCACLFAVTQTVVTCRCETPCASAS